MRAWPLTLEWTALHLHHSQAIEDLSQLIRLLAETHPDPYSQIGGKIAFARLAHQIKQQISPQGLESSELFALLRPLVAAVGDSHTYLRSQCTVATARLWLDFEPVERRLVTCAVYRQADREMLGGALVSLGGIGFDALRAKVAASVAHENDHGLLVRMSGAMTSASWLSDSSIVKDARDALTLELEHPCGTRRLYTLPFLERPPGGPLRPESRLDMPPVNAAGLGWALLPCPHEAALLRINSAARYREAFEQWRHAGIEAVLGSHLQDVSSTAIQGSPPPSIEAQIRSVPSATELFLDLFRAMEEAKTDSLIVDVRDNSEGGNSLIGTILELLLYGEGRVAAARGGYEIPRYSPLYFENYQNLHPEDMDLPEGGDPLGEYDFRDEEAWNLGAAESPESRLATLRSVLATLAEASPTFAALYRQGMESVGASPRRVVVLTSARTFSAGFDIAMRLSLHGARVVGVPSGQAGNSCVDSVFFTLCHSGLKGGIAHKLRLAFPGESERGRALPADPELTYEALAGMAFDPNATLLLALSELTHWNAGAAPRTG